MAWSELLFILFLLLTVTFHQRLISSGRTLGTGAFLALSGATAAACLTRYIGLFLIPLGAVYLLLFEPGTFLRRLRRAAIFSVLSAGPLAAWVVRNLFADGTLFGPRGSPIASVSMHVRHLLETLIHWYIPEPLGLASFFLNLAMRHTMTLAGLGVALAAIALGWLFRNRWRSPSTPFAIVVAATSYTAFLLLSASLSGFDPLGDRLLSPVAPPAAVLLGFAGSSILSNTRPGRKAHLLNVIAAFLVAGWLFFPTKVKIDWIIHNSEEWLEYNHPAWRTSELALFLRDSPSFRATDMPLYSNGPDALYLIIGRLSLSSPQKTHVYSNDLLRKLEDLQGRWPERSPALLAWFDRLPRPFLYFPNELASAAKLQLVKRFSDGALYHIERLGDGVGPASEAL
ncbi:MAG: hypothetical protein NZ740_06545 [Kiritimatiellae bacterium]|nr:hypothetical protein [Kiritimatiellia bacterium]MDW8458755.1 hypothetical protein [Verrucomicrobiota bacterium]